MLQLNPAIDGVYRRYPEYPFNNASLGNPYPYGMDPVNYLKSMSYNV